MPSLILRVMGRTLLPALLVVSWWFLLRGHDEPGGGFVAGLITAGGFTLHALGHGAQRTRQTLRARPELLAAWGLGLATVAGAIGLVLRAEYLSAVWWEIALGQWLRIPLGTPLIFDLGVYLVVTGSILFITLAASAPVKR
jgi:multicomponent Na+:H+ antiporter subunit B